MNTCKYTPKNLEESIGDLLVPYALDSWEEVGLKDPNITEKENYFNWCLNTIGKQFNFNKLSEEDKIQFIESINLVANSVIPVQDIDAVVGDIGSYQQKIYNQLMAPFNNPDLKVPNQYEPISNTDNLTKYDEQSENRAKVRTTWIDDNYGRAFGARLIAAQKGSRVLLSSAIIDIDNKQIIQNDSDLQKSIVRQKENLLNEVLSLFEGRPELEKYKQINGRYVLYDENGKYTGIIEQIQHDFGARLSRGSYTDSRLDELSDNYRDRNKQDLDAYTAWVLLNNFDNLITTQFGGVVTIDSAKQLNDTTKYTYGSKGTNVYTTWRVDEDINLSKEINKITQLLITTCPYIGNSTDLQDKYIKFNQFAYILGKVKNFQSNLKSDYIFDFRKQDSDIAEQLTDAEKELLQGKSLSDVIGSIDSNAQKYFPLIFKLFSLKVDNNYFMDNIVKNQKYSYNVKFFDQTDYNLINSIYQGLFSADNEYSLYSINKKCGFKNANYYAYVTQSANSMFNAKYLQYFRSQDGSIYTRNILDQGIDNTERKIQQVIQVRNGRRIRNFSQIKNKYNIDKTTDGHGIIFELPDSHIMITATTDGSFKLSRNGQSYNVDSTTYSLTKDFIEDILGLNFDNKQDFLDYFKDLSGNNDIIWVNNLLKLSSGVLLNSYITNVDLTVDDKPIVDKAQRNDILKSWYADNLPKYKENYQEIDLIPSRQQPVIMTLARAQALSEGLVSKSTFKDGEGNSIASGSLSRLVSAYRQQFATQNKSLNSATKHFLIMNTGVLLDVAQIREYKDVNSTSTKPITKMTATEMSQSSFMYDFIGGLVAPKNQNKRTFGNGVVGFLASVNSDKPNIGRLEINLNKKVNGKSILELITDQNGNIKEDQSGLTAFIASDFGQYYNKMQQNIDSTWLAIKNLPEVQQYVGHPLTGTNQETVIQEINNAAQYNNESPVRLVNRAVAAYNASHIDNIKLIDQVHISGKNLIEVNPTIQTMLRRTQDAGSMEKFLDTQHKYLIVDLLRDGFSIKLNDDLESNYLKQNSLWNNHNKLVIAKIDGQNILTKQDLYKAAANKGIEIQTLRQKEKSYDKDYYDTRNLSDIMKDLINSGSKITLNPYLKAFNDLQYLFGQEWLNSTVGSLVAHPSKYKYNSNLTEEENELADEASRFTAQIKRNVSMTASMHAFQKGLLNGIPDDYNIAVMADIHDTCYNVNGDIDDGVKPYDGATFVNPFVVYLENYSLGGAAAGVTKKQFVHYYDERTGTGGIIKTAGFGLTNDLIRNSPRLRNMMFNMTHRTWRSEIFNIPSDQLSTDNKGNIITTTPLNSYQVYFKTDDGRFLKRTGTQKQDNGDITTFFQEISPEETEYNTDITKDWDGNNIIYKNTTSDDGKRYLKYGDRYFTLEKIEYIGNNQYRRVLQEIYPDLTRDEDLLNEGKTFYIQDGQVYDYQTRQAVEDNDIDFDVADTINNNYDLWRLFGGTHSYELKGNNLVPSEFSIRAVVQAMNNVGAKKSDDVFTQDDVYQPLKHSDIHYMPTIGSVKQGAANINGEEWYDRGADYAGDEKLNYFTIHMNQAGIQLDKEHHADSEQLSLMTQVISAMAARGYTFEKSSEAYQALASLARVGISDLKEEFSRYFQNPNDEDSNNELMQSITDIVVDSLIHSVQTGSKDTLSIITNDLIDKAKRGDKISFADANIPYSDESVHAKIESIIGVALTKACIKIKIPGVLSVLHPSKGIMKLYGDRKFESYKDKQDLENEQIKYDNINVQLPDIQIGRTYKLYGDTQILHDILNLPEAVNPLEDYVNYTIQTPKEYYTLKTLMQEEGLIKEIHENITVGRDLASYDLDFEDTNGNRYKLWDIDSIARKYSGDENVTTNDIQHDLDALSKNSDIQTVIINGEQVTVNKDSVNYHACEIGMPKTFAQTFGLSEYDDLHTIINDPSWFTKKIIENRASKIQSQYYDIELQRLNGQHVYIISKENVNTINNIRRKSPSEYATLSDKGQQWRVDKNTGEKLFQLSVDTDEAAKDPSKQDEFYEVLRDDGTTVEVIATDNLTHYLDSISYNNIRLGSDTNLHGNQKDIYKLLDAIKQSSNSTAKKYYKFIQDSEQFLQGRQVANPMQIVVQNQKDLDTAMDDLADIIKENPQQELTDEFIQSVCRNRIIARNGNINPDPKEVDRLANRLYRKLKYFIDNGKETHTSFLESLNIIAARIPAQSMQSVMPMKIVFFDNPDRNTAYVSTTQIWLQGSDYDIDSVSLATYAFDRNGKFIGWSPYFNLQSTKLLKLSEQLPFPTSKLCTFGDTPLDVTEYVGDGKLIQIKDGKMQCNPQSEYQLHQLIDLIKHVNNYGLPSTKYMPSYMEQQWKDAVVAIRRVVDSHNMYLSGQPTTGYKFTDGTTGIRFTTYNLNGIQSGENYILTDSDGNQHLITGEEVQKYKNYIYQHSVSGNMKNKDIQNVIKNFQLNRMIDIFSDPANMIESQAAIDRQTSEPKNIANQSPKANDSKFAVPGNFMSSIHGIVQNMTGKEDVGICAVGLKSFFALSQYNNYILKYGTEDQKKRLILGRNGITFSTPKGQVSYHLLANATDGKYREDSLEVPTLTTVENDKTAASNVVIDKNLISDYQHWQNENPGSIVAYRIFKNNLEKGLPNRVIGNPFSVDAYGKYTSSQNFLQWLVTGNNFGNSQATETYRQGIINIILNSPEDTKILYYKKLGYPSHADVINWLIQHKEYLTKKVEPAATNDIENYLRQIKDQKDAALVLSAMLSLSTDNAKELAMANLNAGTGTLGMYLYGISIGMDFNTISKIMMSPLGFRIGELMQGNIFNDEYGQQLNSVFDYFTKGIYHILKKYDAGFYNGNKVAKISDFLESNEVLDQQVPELSRHSVGEKLVAALNRIKTLQEKLSFIDNLRDNIIQENFKYEGTPSRSVRFNLQSNSDTIVDQFIDDLKQYAEDIDLLGNNVSQYNNLKTLADGAQEMRTLGQLLHLNQGLYTNAQDTINFVNTLQNLIADRKQSKGENVTDEDVIDLQKFLDDQDYQNDCIQKYDDVKAAFNILDCVAHVPHFNEYLQVLIQQDNVYYKSMARYRAQKNYGIKAINLLNATSSRDKETIYKNIGDYTSDYIRRQWMIDSGIKITLPKGTKFFLSDMTSQEVQPDLTYIDTLGNESKVTSDNLDIQLGIRENDASFKRFMEQTIIPDLKNGKCGNNQDYASLKQNLFIQGLSPSLFSRTANYTTIMGYSLPINMSPRSDEDTAIFNRYKRAFNQLKGIKYNIGDKSYDLVDLFYYYNLISYRGKRGESTLTNIFEDVLDYDQIKAHKEYEAAFDRSSDIQIDDDTLIHIAAPKASPNHTGLLHYYAVNPQTGNVEFYTNSRGRDTSEPLGFTNPETVDYFFQPQDVVSSEIVPKDDEGIVNVAHSDNKGNPIRISNEKDVIQSQFGKVTQVKVSFTHEKLTPPEPSKPTENSFTFDDGVTVEAPFKVNDEQAKALKVMDAFMHQRGPSKNDLFKQFSNYIHSIDESISNIQLTDTVYNGVPIISTSNSYGSYVEYRLGDDGNLEYHNYYYDSNGKIKDFGWEKVKSPDGTDDAILKFFQDYKNAPDVSGNVMTLAGYAGTGKTSIMQLLQAKNEKLSNAMFQADTNLPVGRALRIKFAATTNAAAKVLAEKTGSAVTVNSLFGITLDETQEKYDTKSRGNVYDEKRGLKNVDVVVIDEASMLGKANYDFINQVCEKNGVKVIYVGDPKQLPPVKSNTISPVFQNKANIVELTKVERTGDNAILKEATELRKQGGQLSMKSSFKDGKGVAYVKSDNTAVLDNIIQTFAKGLQNNSNFFRIIAFDNKHIEYYNDLVRGYLGYDSQIPRVGEPIVGYANWGFNPFKQTEGPKYDFINSESYKVVNVGHPTKVKVEINVRATKSDPNGGYHRDYGVYMTAYPVTIEDAFHNQTTINMYDVVDDKENLKIATKLATEIDHFNALKNQAYRAGDKKKGDKWYKVISAINNFLFINRPIEVQDADGRKRTLKDKVWDFGYAITTHKSQGSTYANTLIDLDNLRQSPDYDTWGTNLEYTALTRASDTATFISANAVNQDSPLNHTQSEGTKMTFYSGAAIGADTYWANAVKSLNGTTVNYTVDSIKSGVLPEQDRHRIWNEYKDVVAALNENVSNNPLTLSLLVRDMLQADSASSIFAVGYLNPNTNFIDGGTRYATMRGILRKIPIHFFNVETGHWYNWDYINNKFATETQPKLIDGAALIGTRRLDPKSKNYNEQFANVGKNAIDSIIADATTKQNKVEVYWGSDSNKELSNFATRPFKIKLYENDPSEIEFNSVEQAFQYVKLREALRYFGYEDTKNSSPIGFSEVTRYNIINDPSYKQTILDSMKQILNETNPATIKQIGGRTKLPDEPLAHLLGGNFFDQWNSINEKVMYTLIKASFSDPRNKVALQKLLNTGKATITHNGDTQTKWRTQFPNILMQVRSELSNTTKGQTAETVKTHNFTYQIRPDGIYCSRDNGKYTKHTDLTKEQYDSLTKINTKYEYINGKLQKVFNSEDFYKRFRDSIFKCH